MTAHAKLPPPRSDDGKLILEIVSGAEGPSVYLNSTRIVGPKPWGGGRAILKFKVEPYRLREALTPARSYRRCFGMLVEVKS